jgi:integrase
MPDREKDKPDAKLRLRVRWNNNAASFNVGYRVDIDKWSNEAQRCKANSFHGKRKIPAAIINREITRFENATQAIFNRYDMSGKTPDEATFRAEFNGELGRKKKAAQNAPNGFWGVWQEFLRIVGGMNNWADTTCKEFKVLQNHIISYDKDISLDKINDNYLQGFMTHLFAIPLKNITARNKIQNFKQFLKWAYKNNYYNGKAHETFEPKLKGISSKLRPVIFLTWNELQHLYYLKMPEKTLEYIKDVFCFCCFTGLRYSDVKKLQKVDIKETFFNVISKKDVDPLKIELNDYSRAIIDKYADVSFPNNRALPVYSCWEMNRNLKIIGKIAEFNDYIRKVYFVGSRRYENTYPKWELLTTHVGRKTFIVNAIFLGISTEVVMKWTGHADYAAMKPYIEIVDSLKEREMKKFNLSYLPQK